MEHRSSPFHQDIKINSSTHSCQPRKKLTTCAQHCRSDVLRASKSDSQPHITSVIWKSYNDNKQTPERLKKKMQTRQKLLEALNEVFPIKMKKNKKIHLEGLYITGSSVTGFGHMKSDMDLTVILNPMNSHPTNILSFMKGVFRKLNFFRSPRIINAKTPLLTFHDSSSKCQCDMSLNKKDGIRNSHLLRAYASYDERVAPLVMFIKHWAKSNRIKSAHQGTFSSFTLTLMVLHYLQGTGIPTSSLVI